MAVDYSLIGSRIKEIRKKEKMTQEALSEKLSVTVGYVSQLERGITKINLDILSQISEILDCDISYFVSSTSTENTQYLHDELTDEIMQLSAEQRKIVFELVKILNKK